VTHSIGDEVHPVKGSETAPARDVGPDPVVGAGISLLGIFLMGTGGASDSHYLFDAGVGIAVLGAGIFVLFVTLSALKQRAAGRDPS
jgi:hypothetical protein